MPQGKPTDGYSCVSNVSWEVDGDRGPFILVLVAQQLLSVLRLPIVARKHTGASALWLECETRPMLVHYYNTWSQAGGAVPDGCLAFRMKTLPGASGSLGVNAGSDIQLHLLLHSSSWTTGTV